MKPYYQDELVTLYHGDFREVLPRLDIAADAVITDPPFGQTSLAWDKWVMDWPSFVRPALKPAGSLWSFGSFRMFWDHVAEFGDYRQAQDIIWEKHNGSAPVNDRFRRVHEMVVHFYPRRAQWRSVYKRPVFTMDASPKQVRRKARPAHWGVIGGGYYISEDGGPRLMRSVIRARSMHRRSINETQKPAELIEPLITYSVPPGGLVLDVFAGSAAVLHAARSLGRRAIGIEVRESQCAKAAAWLRSEPISKAHPQSGNQPT